jgi:hypothetical protein
MIASEVASGRSNSHAPFGFPAILLVCRARVITKVLIDATGQTGIYYDEGGHPMLGSALARDPTFQDRVVAETRKLLSMIPTREDWK